MRKIDKPTKVPDVLSNPICVSERQNLIRNRLVIYNRSLTPPPEKRSINDMYYRGERKSILIVGGTCLNTTTIVQEKLNGINVNVAVVDDLQALCEGEHAMVVVDSLSQLQEKNSGVYQIDNRPRLIDIEVNHFPSSPKEYGQSLQKRNKWKR